MKSVVSRLAAFHFKQQKNRSKWNERFENDRKL